MEIVDNLNINDQYFMNLAYKESNNSNCRRHVGAVLVKNGMVLATGYNAAPIGIKSCQEYGICMRQRDNIKSGTMQEHCKAVHAEQNAIINAARCGISIEDSTIYVTTYPCSICARMLINCSLKRIVYDGDYLDSNSHSMLEESGIAIEKIIRK